MRNNNTLGKWYERQTRTIWKIKTGATDRETSENNILVRSTGTFKRGHTVGTTQTVGKNVRQEHLQYT